MDTLAGLRAAVADLGPRDAHRISRRLDGMRRLSGDRLAGALTQVADDVERARARLERRAATVPAVRYPEQLPVSARKDDIAAAIRDHQVVIVAGETGSGKTTQLPKICLELGRGVKGQIGHTQPRRIAARAVADRIADELGQPLGQTVGYKVRFADRTGEDTLVKLMTDGILLAEIQSDRLLRGYDTIIIDEAHERSLNIDFLLGYLKQLLPRRPDLKLVITSATIETARFSEHFGDAPVVEVSGRTFPVEVRYRPLVEEADDEDDDGGVTTDVVRDQVQAIVEAVQELYAEGPGDVLVFLSGEREIRDTAEALNRLVTAGTLRHTEILPLYSRLSAAEQHRVFSAHTGRRVVLATNVAETSLTVPGIRYVVDPGTARISRFSQRTKVQRLPIEPVSQASANQRAGRCGRVADGICIRLYSEEDFESRPRFTDPEILRTNLASVILQMTALGLGDIAAFPFVEPPDRRAVKDGVDLLVELGAIDPAEADPKKRLTPLGRRLARLPVDPRLGRMVLEADRNGCVREVMVVAAALSIQDVRERPADAQQKADDLHRRFVVEGSDFLTWLKLWDHLREQQRELSSSAFRRLCKREFLNYVRVREWQDLVVQLKAVAKDVEVSVNTEPAAPQAVHQALLAGLLSHVGLRDPEKRDYLGARGARFAVFPGSALFKKQPQWVVAAELVETSRLWGRVCARIEPEWVEPLAGHLVKRTYSEPHWEKKRGAVMAFERVTLYGVPIVAQRKVGYARVDPALARELFIRHALVEGDWETHHGFFAENRALLDDVAELESRVRRRDILVDDETRFAFYDRRIPDDVVSARHFDAWWKKARRDRPDLLTFTEDLLVADDAGDVSRQDFPDEWLTADGLALRLSYQFEPGTDADGVTVHVPVEVLNRVRPDGFEWQISGLRQDLVTALIRALPKAVRVQLVPAPDRAREVLATLEPFAEPLVDALSRELGRIAGAPVPPSAFDWSKVPDHLTVTFRVEDAKGKRLAEGKDLEALRRRLAPAQRRTIASAARSIERTGLTAWPAEPVPRTFTRVVNGLEVQGYPALVDTGDAVDLRVLPGAPQQARAMWAGSRRLLLLAVPSPARQVLGALDNRAKLALAGAPHGSATALFEDCLTAAVDSLMREAGWLADPATPWDAEHFARLVDAVRPRVVERTREAMARTAEILALAAEVDRGVRSVSTLSVLASLTDVREHVARLVRPGFVTAAGVERLPDLARYLRADLRRLETLRDKPLRDRDLLGRVAPVEAELAAVRAELPADDPEPAAVTEVAWLVEELRVSLFAQTLGTRVPVSEKRIYKLLDAL